MRDYLVPLSVVFAIFVTIAISGYGVIRYVHGHHEQQRLQLESEERKELAKLEAEERQKKMESARKEKARIDFEKQEEKIRFARLAQQQLELKQARQREEERQRQEEEEKQSQFIANQEQLRACYEDREKLVERIQEIERSNKLSPETKQKLKNLKKQLAELDFTVEELRKAIGNLKPQFREMNKKLKVLLPDITSKNPRERSKVLESIGILGEDGRDLSSAVVEGMLKFQVQQKEYLECLEKINPELYKHVVTLLVDQDSNNVINAISALGKMGEEAECVIPLLVTKKGQVNDVITVLPKISTKNRVGNRLVISVATGEVIGNQELGIKVMGEVDIDTRTKVRVFIICLNGLPNIKIIACNGLAAIGAEAKVAITVLGNMKTDSNKDVREAVGKAIEAIKDR